jgi:predicted ATPase/class 3 adenylate cyclase
MDATGLPTGTVTLLFTDVEGSTRLLHRLGAKDYAEALAEHRRLLRAAFTRHGGVEVDTQGDAFFVAFREAPGGLIAAADALESLASGPISIRVGVHSGTPLVTDEGYVGVDVHRAARIAGAGHGGQVLVSAATAALVEDDGVSLFDLGEHRLKDLAAPERIYQLGDRPFPPLKTLSVSNLPVPATPFLGRMAELAKVSELLSDPRIRMLTVVGPGGIGKTRLALQAAAESSPAFPDGLWWLPLAPLTDAADVPSMLAQTLGIAEDEHESLEQALRTRLEGQHALVLLDNAEHLLPELTGSIALLLGLSDRITLLVTSRARLNISAEHVFTVSPLSPDDAITFFQERAAAADVPIGRSETMEALCARLDRLPLALQLAAARLRTFSAEQLLERIGTRLELLKGAADLEPRQQTVLATIEWSHELLNSAEQELFRRLAVFVDGCTLDAAEQVCKTDADVLESLVDKSLLQRRDDAPEPRFWMLEIIHDYAMRQLEASDETDELRRRHADFYRGLAERMDADVRAGEPEEGPVSVLAAEINNVRAAVDFGLERGDVELVREITASLQMYWIMRGPYSEARSWLERALALGDGEDDTRRRLLSALGTIAYTQGDHEVAVRASDEAGRLAMQLGGATEGFELLKDQGFAALMKGDFETAEHLFREGLAVAIAVDNGVGVSSCRLNLAYLANKSRRHEVAENLLAENLPFVRRKGQTRCEAHTLAGMAETTLRRERPSEGADDALLAARRAMQIHDHPTAVYCLDLFAVSAAARGDLRKAALILGATEAAREEMGAGPDEDEDEIRARAGDFLNRDAPELQAAWAQGRELDLEAAFGLADNAPKTA